MRIIKKILALAILSISFLGCNKNFSTKNQSPTSIVCLSPAATEIVFAVGAGNCVKAVSEYTDYPPEARNLPVAGSFDGTNISLETILSFEPDLVYLTEGMHDFLIQTLKDNNIPYYLSKGDSIASVKSEILDIGKITGHQQEAKQIVKNMEETINNFSSSNKNNVSLYYEVWTEPYMSVGKSSFMNEMISALGAKNIFGELEEGYPIVSEETIIASQPEVILIPHSNNVSVDDVCSRPGWDQIPAVKNKKIFIIDDSTFSRPGPRIIQSIEEVGALIR